MKRLERDHAKMKKRNEQLQKEKDSGNVLQPVIDPLPFLYDR